MQIPRDNWLPLEDTRTTPEGHWESGPKVVVTRDLFAHIVASVLQSETWMGIEGAGNAAVIGAPDRIKGQAIPAVIVLKEGMQGGKQEFLNYCKENAPDYRVPKTILLRDAIPKDPVGKILKRVLKQESQAV